MVYFTGPFFVFFIVYVHVSLVFKVIVGSCVVLYVSLAVMSHPQGYGHDEDEHVDYYVSVIIPVDRDRFFFFNENFRRSSRNLT